LVDKHIRIFIALPRTKYLSTNGRIIPMDLSQEIQYLTLDIISTIGIGRSFDMLIEDHDVREILESVLAGDDASGADCGLEAGHGRKRGNCILG
jgi:hypothetical protein